MAGFANIRVSGMGPVVHGAKSGVRFVLWKVMEACLRIVQTVEAGPGQDLGRIFTRTIFAVADKP